MARRDPSVALLLFPVHCTWLGVTIVLVGEVRGWLDRFTSLELVQGQFRPMAVAVTLISVSLLVWLTVWVSWRSMWCDLILCALALAGCLLCVREMARDPAMYSGWVWMAMLAAMLTATVAVAIGMMHVRTNRGAPGGNKTG